MFALLITATGLLDVGSSILLRIWANDGRTVLLAAGVLGFALAGLTFAFSMKYQGLAIANIMWIGIAAVLLTVIARWGFREALSPWQIAGIALVIVGVVVLNK